MRNALNDRISIRMEKSTVADLQKIADEKGVSIAWVGRSVLVAYIEDFRKQKQNKSKTKGG